MSHAQSDSADHYAIKVRVRTLLFSLDFYIAVRDGIRTRAQVMSHAQSDSANHCTILGSGLGLELHYCIVIVIRVRSDFRFCF